MVRTLQWVYLACRLALTALGLGFIVASAAPQPAPAAQCGLDVGGRAVLASDKIDPDVFVWDSRDRLAAYESGNWSSTRAIFAHTLLAPSGTRASVVSCYPGVVHARDPHTSRDAIAVRLLSGPYRGHYGWVLSSDVHSGGARNSAYSR